MSKSDCPEIAKQIKQVKFHIEQIKRMEESYDALLTKLNNEDSIQTVKNRRKEMESKELRINTKLKTIETHFNDLGCDKNLL